MKKLKPTTVLLIGTISIICIFAGIIASFELTGSYGSSASFVIVTQNTSEDDYWHAVTFALDNDPEVAYFYYAVDNLGNGLYALRTQILPKFDHYAIDSLRLELITGQVYEPIFLEPVGQDLDIKYYTRSDPWRTCVEINDFGFYGQSTLNLNFQLDLYTYPPPPAQLQIHATLTFHNIGTGKPTEYTGEAYVEVALPQSGFEQ